MGVFDGLVEHYVYRGVARPVTARAYDYTLAGNGLFKRARNGFVAACIPVAEARVAGLPDMEPELELRPGRVPGKLLYSILADARRHAQAGREWMYQVRLVRGLLSARWRVVIPKQVATGARIGYQVAEGETVVCDVHSHHNLAAYFSATDDGDEKGFRFYAVMGRLLTRPEMRLRLGMYGDWWELPATALFTSAGPFVDRCEGDGG